MGSNKIPQCQANIDTTHCPSVVQTPQYKVVGLNYSLRSQTFPFCCGDVCVNKMSIPSHTCITEIAALRKITLT